MLCCCGDKGEETLAPVTSTGSKGSKATNGIRQQGTPNLGDVFPDFTAETTAGRFRFHNWLGNS